MRVLYVSQYFPPEIGAPAARVSELATHWVNRGNQVTALTGFPNHPTGDIHPSYRKRFRRLVMKERLNGIEVVRTWLWPLPNRKPLERILNYSSFCVSATLRGIFLPKPDVVVATSPQLLVGISGWLLARLKRVPFIFEVRDIWPDAIIASGVGSDDSLLARALSRISRFLYRRADHIVPVTPAFIDELADRWDVPRDKMTLVQNGVETDLFVPGDGAAAKKRWDVEGRFVVSYIGTIGLAHGIATVLEAAQQLANEGFAVEFHIVGEGAERESLEKEAEGRGLMNVRFFGQRSREDIPSIVQASDACLVLLKRTEAFKQVIPTKMLEYMASGRPLILGVDGQARSIMEEAEAGVFVEPEDPQALVQAIKELSASPARRDELGSNGRRYIVERLSRRATAQQYLDLFERLGIG